MSDSDCQAHEISEGLFNPRNDSCEEDAYATWEGFRLCRPCSDQLCYPTTPLVISADLSKEIAGEVDAKIAAKHRASLDSGRVRADHLELKGLHEAQEHWVNFLTGRIKRVEEAAGLRSLPRLSPTLEAHRELEGRLGLLKQAMLDARQDHEMRVSALEGRATESELRTRSLQGTADNLMGFAEARVRDVERIGWRLNQMDDAPASKEGSEQADAAYAQGLREALSLKPEWVGKGRRLGHREREGFARGFAVAALLVGLGLGALAVVGLY